MTANPILQFLNLFRRTALLHESQEQSDAQLLDRFVGGDGVALETLVRRHAAMVWDVCRRNLTHHDDAMDAFQATFLVLLRKAASLRSRELLANWLYGVAYKTACKARQTAAKRYAREKQVETMPEPPAETSDDTFSAELLGHLDRELNGLPEKYRTAVVLCELQGRTLRDAAQQLRVAEGTVGSRLARGREMLAQRMSRHGAGLLAGTVAAVCSHQAASGAVPTALLTRTIDAVRLMAAEQPVKAGLLSAEASTLSEAVLHGMAATKWKAASVVLLLAGLALGGGVVAYQNLPDQTRGSDFKIDPEKYGSEVGAKTRARQHVIRRAGFNDFFPVGSKAQFDRLKNEWNVVVGVGFGGPQWILQKDLSLVVKYNPSTRTYDFVSDDWNRIQYGGVPIDGSEIGGWRKVQLKDFDKWVRHDFIKPATTISLVSSGWLVTPIPGDAGPADHAGPQVHEAGKLFAREFGRNALTVNVTPRGVTIFVQDANEKQWICEFGAPEGHFLEVGAYGWVLHPTDGSPQKGYFPYCGIRYKAEGWPELWRGGCHDFVIWELEVKEQKLVRLAIDFSSSGSISGSIRFNSRFELSKEAPRLVAP